MCEISLLKQNILKKFNIILSDKNKLWVLQTLLSHLELKLLSYIYDEKRIIPLCKTNELKSFNLKLYMNIYEKIEKVLTMNNFTITEKNIVSKTELENMRKLYFPISFPLAFHFSGNLNILTSPCVAIVGSRHPTLYGREQAEKFAKYLAEKGICIISGGAIGIDIIASNIALKYDKSLSILGSGLNKPYPLSNQNFFNQIIFTNKGLLFSEFAENTSAQKWNFPRRNLSIAALADFILIIEASETSGSLLTAFAGLDFGKDIGAIPGPLDSINSNGTNSLIQNGAFCIRHPQDIIDRLDFLSDKKSALLF